MKKLADLFMGSFDPQREKKRMLKAVSKSLRKIGAKYYNTKTGKVEPGLAKVFYEFYSTFAPAQKILQHAKSSKVLKTIVIESVLNKDQLDLKERLSEESILKRAQNSDYQQLVNEIKIETKDFLSCFDVNSTREINETYHSLSILLNLIHFDYHFFLRKFDPHLPEGKISYAPRFESTNAEHVSDELQEFLEILPLFDPAQNWNALWDMLRTYRSTEIIAKDAWRKLLSLIRKLRRTRELELVVQLIKEDPFYKPKLKQVTENIVDGFLSRTRHNIELTLQKISKQQRSSTIQSLLKSLFGSSSYNRLINYTEESNELIVKKGMGGFTLTLPLNCLHAFLKDVVLGDLRQLVELLLIPAKWTDNSPSKLLSDSFHQLQDLVKELDSFDAKLSEENEEGRRLQSMVSRADKNPQAQYMARKILKKINDGARNMLVRSCQSTITLGKVLKQLYEDYKKPNAQMILNWREINTRAKRDMGQLFVHNYQKLYHFVQLVKLYV
ncbi:MAG: hypothetical protein JSV89_15065 [Spirochaetaceae bacterium]|nr:MAG: hypothetical protein JSV89_15065 [Spirochaetaceae bacterium]